MDNPFWGVLVVLVGIPLLLSIAIFLGVMLTGPAIG